MPKFCKRPLVVEAQQWWPPGDPRHDPSMLVRRLGHAVDPPDYIQPGDLIQFSKMAGADHIFLIHTPEGQMEVSPGDWIITGVKGEKYPCKPDIFDATYDPAEGEPQAPLRDRVSGVRDFSIRGACDFARLGGPDRLKLDPEYARQCAEQSDEAHRRMAEALEGLIRNKDMEKMRCKVKLTSIAHAWNDAVAVTFTPVDAGCAENKAFHAATPSGEFKATISKDAVAKLGAFVLGREYYVDFSRADPIGTSE